MARISVLTRILRSIFLDDPVKGIGHAAPALVAEPSGSDGCSAALAIEHQRRICRNLKSVVPEPLTDLRGIDIAGLRHFADTHIGVFPDVLLYFLEFGFQSLSADRAQRRTGDVIEQFAAISAIPNIHALHPFR